MKKRSRMEEVERWLTQKWRKWIDRKWRLPFWARQGSGRPKLSQFNHIRVSKYSCVKMGPVWWAARYKGSILASHPAARGSNPGSANIFLLTALLVDKFWDRTHLVLSNGFYKCSQGWHPELSSTKKVGSRLIWDNVLELALCLTKNAFLRWGRHRVSICTSHLAALGSMLVAPNINWGSLLRPRTEVVN